MNVKTGNPPDFEGLIDEANRVLAVDRRIAPELKRYPSLAELDGQPVQLPEELRPQRKYIQEHATAARASWK